MVPGLSSAMEERLAELLDDRVTEVDEARLAECEFTLLSGAEALPLGLQLVGGGEVLVVVTDPARPLGQIRLQVGGSGTVLFFDNRVWSGGFEARIRVLGDDGLLFFNDIGDSFVALNEVFLRSMGQLLYWGYGASAVGLSVEMDGDGRSLVVGDDALISGGVWVRNFDMHAMHDLRTGALLTRPAVDTVIERHVWLGQDALLLNTERVGMGAIVGARSLVKGHVPPRVAVGGTPARVLREGVSWGRSALGMTGAERLSIGLPELPIG